MHWLTSLYRIQDPTYFTVAIILSTVLFVALMWALHQLPPAGKKWLTIVATFIAGLFFIIEFFWPTHKTPDGMQNWLTPWVPPVSDFVQNIMVWTLFLGIISLVMVHGTQLFKRRAGWHNSLAFFVAMIAMAAAGLASHMGHPKVPGDAHAATLVYNNLYTGLLMNLDSTMFALLAFYIASAAYRAFRISSVEAGLLMVSALIIMLGFVNIGVWLTHLIPDHSNWGIFRIEQFSQFILRFINSPTSRAVTIGVAIGALAMAMRIWLSLERGAFFSQEQ